MTQAVLLDTDVFSFIHKRDSRAELYRHDLADAALVVSFMSAAELHAWAMRRRWSPTRLAGLEDLLSRHPVVYPDAETTRLWARIATRRASLGRRIETSDCWIAATALRHGLPLITHNARDFADIPGLNVITRARPA